MFVAAGTQTAPDQEPPSAILWLDPHRQFEPLAARLRRRLTLYTLGPYVRDEGCGPSIWVRCLLAGSPGGRGPDGVPIVYLPDYGRDALRDTANAPPELQPLAELQFRGIVIGDRGRDWTMPSLLTNCPQLRLRVAQDPATRLALQRAFPRLLDEPVDVLRQAGELDASFFDELMTPDSVRTLLQWLSDPEGVSGSVAKDEWSAFASVCRLTYKFDPDTDGPISAARYLGDRKGHWAQVWSRFLEGPERYPGVAARLAAAQPETLFFDNRNSWPLLNAEDEKLVRAALVSVEGMPAAEARQRVQQLEAAHGGRRSWVWARLGQAPLAAALEQLSAVAKGIEQSAPTGSPHEIGAWYADVGWQVDAAAMKSLACAEAAEDVRAVEIAVTALYGEWLDRGARTLQSSLSHGVPEATHEEEGEPGTCIMFVDGLRLDVAHDVAAALSIREFVEVQWRFAAIPTVTSTAKPAVSPIAPDLFQGPELAASTRDGGPALSAVGFRKLLADRSWQYIGDGSWGDPAGRGWTEGGDIDTQGHTLAGKFPRRLASEVKEIAERVLALLDLGWRRVVIVTDHGWLYLPGGLPKVELPIHATEVRKGRCARVAEGANVVMPTFPWRWNSSTAIAVATGSACFEADKEYEHGGVSPQELVTPRVVVERPPQAAVSTLPTAIRGVKWVGLRCRLQVADAPVGASGDLRTKPADAGTSLLDAPKAILDGKCSIVVPDDTKGGLAAIIVVLAPEGGVIAQRLTTVGGEVE